MSAQDDAQFQTPNPGESKIQNPKSKILCVGQIVADVVVRPVDALPAPGTLAMVEDLRLVPGGCACNTAAVLAKLGASVHIAGLVGDDAIGEAIIAQVVQYGVDVHFVRRSKDVPTSSVIVVVPSDGRQCFLYCVGGTEKFDASMVPTDHFDSFGYVHIGGAMKLANLNLAHVMRDAQAAGCVTSLDTDWDPSGRWMSIIEPALPHLDYLITNDQEGQALTGLSDPAEIGRRLLFMGPGAVVVKLGENGSLLVDSDGVQRFPGVKVDVLDTTCAGDSFIAGLLFGLSSGRSLSDSMRLGNAAGALCTTQLSHFAIDSLESVEALL
ncbi:MAG: carbohydrate kinase family protein [Fimbriimonadales bacterium]